MRFQSLGNIKKNVLSVDGLLHLLMCFTFHISVALNWWNVSRTEMKAVLFVDLITQGKQLLLVACSLCYSSFSLLQFLRTIAFLLGFLKLHIFYAWPV